MSNMQELLESDNILAEPRVVAAWHGLVTGKTEWKHNDIESCYDQANNQAHCTKCADITARFYKEPNVHVVRTNKPCPIPDPIDVSIYEAAFRMRDACVEAGWIYKMRQLYLASDESTCFDVWFAKSTTIHWIAASVACWEGRNEKG